jgi:RNA polymerase sigma-70 factor (ECF subfamily)
MSSGRAALVALLRDEGPGVLATLGRQLGSLPLAEDALQDAVVRALEVWPREGAPASPRGWLLFTARRRALDVLRREARRAEKEGASVTLLPPQEEDDGPVEDDLLRLLFTCCHPVLDRSTQVALALKWLCGLSTAQVGRLLIVPEAAMARRLSRARTKIAVARIPYRVPAAEELPERVSGVLATVHLLFTEGYSATGPGEPLQSERVAEALQLARLLRRLLPDDAGTCGLLALVLLHSAREPARFSPDGGLVLLRDQDRTLWSRALVREGVALVGEGLARTPLRPDRYVVQAAIAACHCLAPTWQATEWSAVVSWYDVLAALDRSPVVRLNRAVAVAERDGPAAGLAALDGLMLPGYALLPATRAELLTRLGQTAEAAAALRDSLALPLNDAQQRLLEQRLAQLVKSWPVALGRLGHTAPPSTDPHRP